LDFKLLGSIWYRPPAAIIAETLFWRRPLALYQEGKLAGEGRSRRRSFHGLSLSRFFP
jgi:hypothetical protein